ncbi:hypothetical protein ABB37_06396 [Leptomonas pyrrhocoris]|uniref:ABC transporter domain-containing protein n=1 Tax=Leptomonas pyrrhocoris TaxID=157538 RepID=A0A0N0DU09_LEPPY|nr:hypothetical protein ABB37_06396 [Leptomonas pyrrhocoris]KPA78241.1 hypothetical protein ABB37_06396 [Leptomonas pyrrhocoris]|eukprot:XP_015656680.1 hypothetical protein ABB37_06396 [Leptomonas pyrrhocoris]
MSSSIPLTKASADREEESLSQPSLSPTTTTPRHHRHRHHHHTPLASADTNLNNDANQSNANNADQNPLIGDNDGSPAASSRSRTRRSRRPHAASRVDAAFGLLGDDARDGLAICCDGVSVQRSHRDVIDEAFCLFRGGRVTALVNCCGTHSALALLTAVAGRVDCAAGNIVMNGVPVSASAYQAQMSFVEGKNAVADDDDYGGGGGGATGDVLVELTVRENLEYASALRVANSAQAYSVEEVMQQLLLEPHAPARVRDCSLYVRRRVALGKELLLNPSVLLLDEPMDGLATHEAQQFLTILSKLAAPSAADAEARHAIRQAMAASASASSSLGGVDVNAAASITEPSTSSARASVYTPRHSRVHRRDSNGVASSSSPPSSFVPLSTAGAQPNHTATADVNSAAEHELGAPLMESTQRVVILSMVQPRWALLQYVHDVVLLERSRCVFSGTVQDMLSVRLPKAVLRPRMSDNVDDIVAAAGAREDNDNGDNDERSGDNRKVRSARQVGASQLTEDAPADSYDAVAASIHKTRLNEELVHGLYRLAATAPPGGVVAGTEFPFFAASFTDNPDAPEPQGSSPTSGGRHSTSSSFIAVRADGNGTASLSQLYAVLFGHARAQVTAYMEVCAAGLLSLPDASHQAPSGAIQLLQLFRFGFIELRHRLLGDLVALAFMLAAAAALAALYGVQVGDRGIQNCAGILFFLVCCVVLQAVLSLDAQRREYAAFCRYARSGYYAAWTFLVFRAVTAALWRFGLASFVALVVFVLSNFGEPWREYRGVFELGVIMAVLSYCCYFLIWFLCAWWPSDRVSRVLVFAFYTFNIVLGGLVLNLTTLPPAVQGVSFLSVVRLAYESSMLTHFAGRTFGCNKTAPDGSSSSAAEDFKEATWRTPPHPAGAAARRRSDAHLLDKGRHGAHSAAAQAARQGVRCYTGAEYAAYMGFEPSHRWSNVGILAGLSAALLLASWILMVLYRPRRRLRVIT